jgi:mono/diheme cytochrome c family protein/glucose/arabinose dehydrogenase
VEVPPQARGVNSQGESHFTPEVEKYLESFVGAGEGINGAGDLKAPSPEESIRQFTLLDGLEMELVASEPTIRQPLQMHFDERGRLWVAQYIQYPFPAGLKVVQYDKYLRAVFDKVPQPPPKHVHGADKITILEDTDHDGRFESHKEFVEGLNIASSVAVGRGGVWVLNPPYLLFYPDKNHDDVPDGDPEVRLSGFGLEDTHAVANNLHWGPDGWLYGVQGSTTTSNIQGIHWLGQAVWRYHPEQKKFELFAEGGGNPWTLDFDSKGRTFVGTNVGAARGLHFVQGGYYVKNWPKHGPLTNPYAFGFFPHMPHSGYQPRFSQTLVVYEGGALPRFEGQLISGMALTNRMQASQLVKDTSSFRTVDTEAPVLSDSRWFRPVDTKTGPDGAIYVADWTDFRLSHLSPTDNWEKSNGRIYRLKAAGAKPVPAFDLSRLSSDALLPYLSHQNRWFREQAKRILGDRGDSSVVPQLKVLASSSAGQLALEALWSLNLSGGFDPAFALQELSHPDPYVRCWTVRLLGDARTTSPAIEAKLIDVARTETEPEVRSQLASSCKRFQPATALPVLRELMLRNEDANDVHIPLLLWWALESKITTDRDAVIRWLKDPVLWQSPIFVRHIASRLGRRLTAERGKSVYTLREGEYSEWQHEFSRKQSSQSFEGCVALLNVASGREGEQELLKGMESGLHERLPIAGADRLQKRLAGKLKAEPADAVVVSLATRLGMKSVTKKAFSVATDRNLQETQRLMVIDALADSRVHSAIPVMINLVKGSDSEALRTHVAGKLKVFDDPSMGSILLAVLPQVSPAVSAEIQILLAGQKASATRLLQEVDSGTLQPGQVPETVVTAIRKYGDPECDRLIQKYWATGGQRPMTTEERTAFTQGEQIYLGKCTYCHLASGNGVSRKPLVGSKWVLGDGGALVRIVLQGKQGESEMMPAFGEELNDLQIASVLSYLRQQWGNHSPGIRADMVHEVRLETANRKHAWREEELSHLLR